MQHVIRAHREQERNIQKTRQNIQEINKITQIRIRTLGSAEQTPEINNGYAHAPRETNKASQITPEQHQYNQT